jgi:hypothetical protein
MKPITFSRRLLVVFISLVVAFGMIVVAPLTAYGATPGQVNPDTGKMVPTTALVLAVDDSDNFADIANGVTPDLHIFDTSATPFVKLWLMVEAGYPTGDVTFTLKKDVNGGWVTLGDRTIQFGSSSNFIACRLDFTSGVGDYRIYFDYTGDVNYDPVSNWNSFSIKAGTPSGPNPPATPYIPPASTPAAPVSVATPVVAAPAPVIAVEKPKPKATTGTTKKSTKVYTKPSSRAKVLKTLKKGSKVVITNKTSKFYKITLKIKGKTRTGYVLRASVKVKK